MAGVPEGERIDWKRERTGDDAPSLAERLGIGAETVEKYRSLCIPIEELALSVRASNALHRAACHMVADVLSLSAGNLFSLTYMGEKSASEIVEKLVQFANPNECAALMEDVPAEEGAVRFWMLSPQALPLPRLFLDRRAGIERLELSIRSYNALKRHGYHTVGQLWDIPTEFLSETLLAQPHIGQKIVDEIAKQLSIVSHRAEGPAADGEAGVCLRVLRHGQPPDQWTLSSEAFAQIKATVWRDVDHLTEGLRSSPDATCDRDPFFQADCLAAASGFEETALGRALTAIADDYGRWLNAARLSVPWMLEQVSRLSGAMPLDDSRAHLLLKRADVCNALFHNPDTLSRVQRCIFTSLERSDFGRSYDELAEHLPDFLRRSNALPDCLQTMLAERRILEKGGRYEPAYATVAEYLDAYRDAKAVQMTRARLGGSTLSAIAAQHGITRERVRQIVSKVFDKRRMPRLYEDRYIAFFQRYKISAEDAESLFEADWTHPYLNQRCRPGTLPLDDALDDTTLPVFLRARVQSCIYRGHLRVDGAVIPPTREGVITYVLRTLCAEDTKLDDFFDMYQMFRRTHGLEDPKYEADVRTLSNQISGRQDVLWKFPARLRYYPILEYDFTELLDALVLDSYVDVELSAALFIKTHPELMARYDIRDEYELHNLLKKILPAGASPISFSRMPMLVFGNANRDGQVFELMLELAPVSNTDLAIAYEERYGVRAVTVLANFLRCIEVYFDGGIYHIDNAPLGESQRTAMQEALTDECYAISHMQRIYLQIFPQGRASDINAYSIRQMGFHPYAGYAVHARYRDSRAYFTHWLTRDVAFNLDDLPPGISSLNQFFSILNGLRRSYEILELEPRRYIALKQLQATGVERTDIEDYCKAVYDFCQKDTFYTIRYLRAQGFRHSLDALGQSDWFYSGLLFQRPDLFGVNRMCNTRVFVRGQKKFTRTDVIAALVCGRGYVQLSALLRILDEAYGIPMERDDLLQRISTSMLYYDRLTDQLCMDYDHREAKAD